MLFEGSREEIVVSGTLDEDVMKCASSSSSSNPSFASSNVLMDEIAVVDMKFFVGEDGVDLFLEGLNERAFEEFLLLLLLLLLRELVS